jgi:hypothetical protein
MQDTGCVMKDERTAQSAVATSLPTIVSQFPILHHIKELREFKHGGLVKGCPTP